MRPSKHKVSKQLVFSGSSKKQAEDEQEESVWDKPAVLRGKAIQEQQHVRNLPDNFPAFSAYDSATGKATAETSIDIRDVSYQKPSALKSVIKGKCRNMQDFEHKTYGGVTLDAADIKSKELIIYIPSSAGDRTVDRSQYDKVVKEVQKQYPDIQIVTKEIN